MVRQAHKYLVGAVSSVTLVSIAIAAFVFLVSAQVFTDWPLAVLGGGNDKAAISEASALGGDSGPAVAAAKTVVPGAAPTAAATATTGGKAGGPSGGTRADTTPQPDVGASEIPSNGGEPVATVPSTGTGQGDTGSQGSEGGSGSNQGAGSESGSGSNQSSPGSSSGGNASSSGGGSGAKGGSSSGSTPSAPSAPAESPPAKAPSTSAAVTETVNETVNSVDETVTGGALQESGVTEVTESVVNGVAGPESVVGKTVDGVGEAVGGLLGGSK